jgi:hypothetical protein
MRNFGRMAATGYAAIVGSMLQVACAPLQQQFPILALIAPPPRPPALALRAEDIPTMPQYRAVRLCRYNARMSDGIHVQADAQTLTVRQVRDRFLVTSSIGAEQSTALISRTGHIYDFNAADASGTRLTPEGVNEAKSEGNPEINNIGLYIPSYMSGPVRPGQIVAHINDSSGNPQVAFVYRGLVSYQSREAVLLDIVRSNNGADMGRTLGFSIVDRSRALPVLFAVAGNPSIRVEQVGCED